MKRPTTSMPIFQDAQTKNEPTTLSMMADVEEISFMVRLGGAGCEYCRGKISTAHLAHYRRLPMRIVDEISYQLAQISAKAPPEEVQASFLDASCL